MAAKDIYLYGVIGEDIQPMDIINQIKDAENDNLNCNFKINSPGGSVFDGLAIYNAIKQASVKTSCEVDGLAASMATIVMAACNIRSMSKNSMLMIHKPQMSTGGDAGQIKNDLQLLEGIGDKLADIYSQMCGKPLDWIQANWMVDGKQTWMTADEALVNGLIHYSFDGDAKTAVASELKDVDKVYSFYKDQIKPKIINQIQKPNMKAIALALGLKEDASEGDILKAITDLQTSKKVSDEIADQVISQGAENITDEKNKTFCMELAKTDKKKAVEYLTLQATVAGVQPRITDLIKPGQKKIDGAPEDLDDKECFDYLQKHDSKKLEAMQNSDPEKFNKIVAEYQDGKRYTGKK